MAAFSSVVGDTDIQTLTNKRITLRVNANSAANSLTPNTDNYDIQKITLTSGVAFTLNAPTGTPNDGDMWLLELTWLSGASPAYTFNAIYVGSTGLPLPASGSVSKTDLLLWIYSTDKTKWILGTLIQGVT